jgi:hypothetical protein
MKHNKSFIYDIITNKLKEDKIILYKTKEKFHKQNRLFEMG